MAKEQKEQAEAEANRKAAALVGQGNRLKAVLAQVRLDDEVRVVVNVNEEAVEVRPGPKMEGFIPRIRIAAVLAANGIGYREVGRGRIRLDKPF